ncbi:hypothetical protein FHX48_000689 [Microbacterium halimionae]|uniref:Uncharacterized protein n=1 Tax=Microbacterium halimionae TaxID=1526413 RepID=A0A7W3PL70_9MICO|nr:hypothetical protein [Microbacterium halimionae]NII95684.1 hypothetical protein [Microbacterium halimionae]
MVCDAELIGCELGRMADALTGFDFGVYPVRNYCRRWRGDWNGTVARMARAASSGLAS